MKKKNRAPSEPQECTIDKLVFGGWGLTHIDNRAVFVSNVAEGERVMARIYKKAKGVRFAEAESFLTRNPVQRTEKRCIHAGICGGCTYQHLSYDAQIDVKEKILREIFPGQELLPTIRSPRLFNYRNKMEYGFTRPPGGEITLGLHPRGRFRHILDLKECHLIEPLVWQTVEAAKKALRELDNGSFTAGERGFWQHLTLRYSFSLQQLLVTFEVEDPDAPIVRKVIDQLAVTCPHIIGFHVKKRHGAPSLVKGSDMISEEIKGARLSYRAENFFQVNISILPEVMDAVLPLVAEANPEVLYDLFSGVGFFGVCIGKNLPQIPRIIAAESDETAARLANENALQNRLQNYTSLRLDLYDKNWAAQLPKASGKACAIIDPPRAGLMEKTVAEIGKLSPQRLIYVSCNPTTQKRDIDMFQNMGYKLKGLRLLDMFPQTYHLESLAWLDK